MTDSINSNASKCSAFIKHISIRYATLFEFKIIVSLIVPILTFTLFNHMF